MKERIDIKCKIMNANDISNFKAYKTSSISPSADTAVLLYKLINIVDNWNLDSSEEFQNSINTVNSSLASALVSLANLLDGLDLSNSSLAQLTPLLSNSSELLSTVSYIKDHLPSSIDLDSYLSDESSIPRDIKTLSQSLLNIEEVAQRLDLKLPDTVLPTSSQLSLSNSKLDSIVSKLNDLKVLLSQSRLNTAHSYPHFLFVPLPLYPNLLYVKFPQATTSFSISIVSELAAPDTFNTSARFHYTLLGDENYVIDPDLDSDCPCLTTKDQIASWYPFFLGTEEVQTDLVLPSDLLLRITHLGATDDLKLAIKCWTRQYVAPTFWLSGQNS